MRLRLRSTQLRVKIRGFVALVASTLYLVLPLSWTPAPGTSEIHVTGGRRRALFGGLSGLIGGLVADVPGGFAIDGLPQSDVVAANVSTAQTYLRMDSQKNVVEVVRANLSTRVVRPPSNKGTCHGAQDGDLLAIRYAAAFKLPQSEAVSVDEAALDLLEDPTPGMERWYVFDTSDQRALNQPFQLPLGNGNVIRGLEIALHGMCEGEQRVLYIPPAFAYGAKGNKNFEVPPNALLRYDVDGCLCWFRVGPKLDVVLEGILRRHPT